MIVNKYYDTINKNMFCMQPLKKIKVPYLVKFLL